MGLKKNAANAYGKLFIRLLSVLLVLALVSGVLVYRQTDLPDMSGRELRLEQQAANQILTQSQYGKASHLTRMRMFLQNLLGRKDSAEDYETAMAISLVQGKYDTAAQFAELALLACDDAAQMPELYKRTGYLYALAGETEAATEYLDKGADADAQAYLVLAELSLERGDANAAGGYAKLYEGCAKDDGLLEYALPILANVYYAVGDYELAYENALAAVNERVIYSKSLYYCVAMSAYKLGYYERAAEYALKCYKEKAISGEKIDTVQLYRASGESALRTGDYTGAEEWYTLLIELEPDNIENRYWRGSCRAGSGDCEGALEDFALCEDMGESVTYAEALCLYSMGRNAEAALKCRKILETSRNDSRRSVCESILLDISSMEDQQ